MDIDDIINLAEEFECCPECGNENIDAHYCPECRERITEPDDAHWFAVKLKRMRSVKA